MAFRKNGKAGIDCISEDALIHLKSYKYSSVDKSPISYYILRHYWNACVEFLPLWLAPNMVTLLGFFFILGNVIMLEMFDPDMIGTKAASPWLLYSYAFGVWMYSTMDNIDGKQARRTGTSSGLGELFDHGIDSLNCTLASLLETSAMALGSTRVGAFTAIVPCLPMFFSTWETFHTHTLYLGYFNGPTEGLIIASTIMAVSGYFGSEMWHLPLARLFGNEDLLGETTFMDLWVPIILFAFTVAHVPSCILNVIAARREKDLPIWPVFVGWTPMIVFTLSLVFWLDSPDSHLLKDNHLTLLCLILSFVFGRMTTKMILAHLTRQPFPYWTMMLAPLVGGAALVNIRRIGLPPVSAQVELYYLWGYFFYSMTVYFRWAFVVVNAICNFLGINCLTIPKEKYEALLTPNLSRQETPQAVEMDKLAADGKSVKGA